ncbi:N-acetylglucosamine kinase [Virgibacillus kekensis]|uniref:N-acetylglucosamine kinase n=1 Tax=Virgibacillus kekensis TaxID=202261 RepID=A0ABV9DFW7_9BACI
MDHVIGIDGGGTKTSAVIADSDGRIIIKAIAGPTNPNVVPHDEVFETLSTLFNELKNQFAGTALNITTVFAGVSGAGNDTAKKALMEMISKLVDATVEVVVEADPINALYSGTYGQPGIVQISGTGSITYGINSESEHGRVGGWGYLFGDEGSGYDLGRQGVIAVLKAADGRGKKTILQENILEYFQVNNEFDLVQNIYTAPSPKSEISAISRMVLEAYRKEDKVAREIVADIVKEMGVSINTLHQKLFNEREKVKVVLCGGVFKDKDILPQLLKAELKEAEYLQLTAPEMSPVGGSVIGALLHQNKEKPREEVIQTIISTI